MDALDLLKGDHERINSLFKEFDKFETKKEKVECFKKVRDELLTHTFIEETVFYPTFSKYEEFKEIIEQSFLDHKEFKELLSELTKLSQESAEKFETVFHDLVQSVEHHVEEEENTFFPMVRRIMRRPERDQLGRHLSSAKEEHKRAA